MIFELDNVELYFKNKRILNGIYLKAETGTVTGILGSNGCGKSCLLDILFGNLKPKYKLIRIDNLPLLKPLYQTRLVKYLPQYHFVPNGMKLKSVFKLYDLSWDIFADKFESYSKYKSTRFSKLSGGERRFIEIYLVLKSKSQLVLLDEPFTHLSPKNIQDIKSLISEEVKQKAIIVTDHMYKQIIEIADRVYLLKNGCTNRVESLKELEDYQYLNNTNK